MTWGILIRLWATWNDLMWEWQDVYKKHTGHSRYGMMIKYHITITHCYQVSITWLLQCSCSELRLPGSVGVKSIIDHYHFSLTSSLLSHDRVEFECSSLKGTFQRPSSMCSLSVTLLTEQEVSDTILPIRFCSLGGHLATVHAQVSVI